MKPVLLSMLSSLYVFAASDHQSIVNEVAKLREKYEECRQGQSIIKGIDPKVYEQCRNQHKEDAKELTILYKRIADLESKLNQAEARLTAVQKNAKQIKVSSTPEKPRPITPAGHAVTAEQSRITIAADRINKSSDGITVKKQGASVYRMSTDASIYDAPDGRIIDTWEARRSFTSGKASNGWVKITGYFVNRVWQSVREDEHLWVRESDVIRR